MSATMMSTRISRLEAALAERDAKIKDLEERLKIASRRLRGLMPSVHVPPLVKPLPGLPSGNPRLDAGCHALQARMSKVFG